MTLAGSLRSLLLVLGLAVALTQNPEELLRQSDVGTLSPHSFRARLVLKAGAASHEIEVWRSGEAKTLIRFMDQKARGKYLLRLSGQVWLLTPTAKQPVRLSPSYRLYGGATLDEILGIRLAATYAVESASRESDTGGALVTLELRAKAEGALFPQVRYIVRESTMRPVSATYRLRSGRDATIVVFEAWHQRFPSHLIVKDLLRKGAETDVNILEIDERAIADGLFSLQDPAERRALELMK